LNKANEHGKETIIFGVEPGFSTALKNSADYVILMDKNRMSGYDDEGKEKKPDASELDEYKEDECEESVEKT
ncbi:MAG: NYN domain-containing protein, partial [Methanosarcina sp.]|nr:NYN domain-containing protein [Methanosarcina sp.]